ncbi:energy transducer TonB [Pedobacter nototheniae]|uniref:energy transducer TonB n=1 Tax=Pedobacter nototheniae TaxID=2488994 RepID=UPI00292DB224|nr:energy transducer TonB [Pedobacter nototheniae]
MQFIMCLIWSNVCLITLYLLYLLCFKNSTFFIANRIYLLSALAISMLIPFITVFKVIAPVQVNVISVYISTSKIADQVFVESAKYPMRWLFILYWLGVAISSLLFLTKLMHIKKFLINPPVPGLAFTFWRTKVIDPGFLSYQAINEHESIHAKQLHTIDVLLMEMIGVFYWFNPIIYSYKRSIRNVHEFLADEHASRLAGSKKNYAMMLFCQTFKASPDLANAFSGKTQLQMRVNMLQKRRSSKSMLFKYLFVVPVLFLLVVLSSSIPAGFNKSIVKGVSDKMASFPGGFQAFEAYLKKSALKVNKAKGRVVVSFIVDLDGTVRNEKIVQHLSDVQDEEALRMIRMSPKWKPAIQNNQIVRSSYQIGLNF